MDALVALACRTPLSRYWYDQLLNFFIETIENLSLTYMRRSSIIAAVSSMSILRYRFSPLRWSGLFFDCDPASGRQVIDGRGTRPQDEAEQRTICSARNRSVGSQALSRPRMAVNSLRMATRSIGTLAMSAPGSGRLSSLLRAPLMVKPCSYSSSRMRRISSTS